jgi:hypothetical protein
MFSDFGSSLRLKRLSAKLYFAGIEWIPRDTSEIPPRLSKCTIEVRDSTLHSWRLLGSSASVPLAASQNSVRLAG